MKYEQQAAAFCKAICELANDEQAMGNMVSYLSAHFDTWLTKYAATPDDLVYELQTFASMYQEG